MIPRAWRKKDLEEVPPVLASGKSQNQRVAAIVVSVVSVGGQCNLDWWKNMHMLWKSRKKHAAGGVPVLAWQYEWSTRSFVWRIWRMWCTQLCLYNGSVSTALGTWYRHLPAFSVNSSMSSFDWVFFSPTKVETHGEVVCLPCKHLAICSFCSKYLGLLIRHAQGEDPGENMVGNVGFIWAMDRSFRSCFRTCYRTSWKKVEVGLCCTSCLEGIRGVLNKYHLHLHHITSTAFHRRVWNFNTLASIWNEA